MNPFFARHKTRKITSSLLAVWLSGFVLLFCCGAAEATAEKEHCPLAKAAKTKSHCDKSEKTKQDATVADNDSGLRFDCCGFLPAVFDKSRKIEKTTQIASLSHSAKVDAPRFFAAENHFAIGVFYRQPEFVQKKIFIKNRVFRI